MSYDLADDGLEDAELTCMECGDDVVVDRQGYACHVDEDADADHVARPDMEDLSDEFIPMCGMVHQHRAECYS